MNFWIEITPIEPKYGSGKTVLHLGESTAALFMMDVLGLNLKQAKRLLAFATENTNSKHGFTQVPYLRIEVYADKD